MPIYSPVKSGLGREVLVHTVQILVAHLIAHVSNEQRLTRRALRPRGPRAGSLPPDVVLHRHPPALKNLLIHLLHRPSRGFLRRKLDVCKPLAQTPTICNDASIADLAVSAHLGFELRSSDFEKQVANVENAGRFWCRTVLNR